MAFKRSPVRSRLAPQLTRTRRNQTRTRRQSGLQLVFGDSFDVVEHALMNGVQDPFGSQTPVGHRRYLQDIPGAPLEPCALSRERHQTKLASDGAEIPVQVGWV